jgi:hypothetical protein
LNAAIKRLRDALTFSVRAQQPRPAF